MTDGKKPLNNVIHIDEKLVKRAGPQFSDSFSAADKWVSASFFMPPTSLSSFLNIHHRG